MRTKRDLVFGLGALIIICSTAGAVLQTEHIGPYNVSFDLGVGEIAEVTYYNTSSETLAGSERVDYRVKIGFPNEILEKDGDVFLPETSSPLIGYATMIITDYLSQSSEEIPKLLSENDMYRIYAKRGGEMVGFASREIDGCIGVISSGYFGQSRLTPPGYLAQYNKNETWVYIESHFFWDEGTLPLLKTIHVEKTETSDM
ncbi:MAG TPA: hypothetical protein PLN41_06075 [Methanothrix sp.]|nr:hypothetical protein [Methanothrix sp.]